MQNCWDWDWGSPKITKWIIGNFWKPFLVTKNILQILIFSSGHENLKNSTNVPSMRSLFFVEKSSNSLDGSLFVWGYSVDWHRVEPDPPNKKIQTIYRFFWGWLSVCSLGELKSRWNSLWFIAFSHAFGWAKTPKKRVSNRIPGPIPDPCHPQARCSQPPPPMCREHREPGKTTQGHGGHFLFFLLVGC